MELCKDLRLMFQEKDRSELGEIIDKTHIIIVLANTTQGRPPHIRKYKLKKSFGHTKRFRER
jgi:hypothetical protein